MKLVEKDRTITRSEDFAESEARIKASALAFDILSSKIYTDPIRAIIRELSTNAYDSHVAAGKKGTPFEIHLPNALEPHFSIRDFGTGLSPEDIQDIYKNYFESNRCNSDDFTGCMGIGSKSPFSYVDSFTITSFFKGRMFVYSYFKSEKGIPTIALLLEQFTNESNGLKIELNVKQQDYSLFATAANKVYQFFTVKPLGLPVCNYPEHVVTGSGYAIYQTSSYNTTIQVVMGQISYSIEPHDFVHKLGHSGSLIIYAEMGSCSITPGREVLHIDDRTKRYIQTRITASIYDAEKTIQESIPDNVTTYERIRRLNECANILQAFSNKGMPLIEDQKFSGRIISTQTSYRNNNIRLYIEQSNYYREYTPHDKESVFIEEDVEVSITVKKRLKAWLMDEAYIKGSHVLFKIQDKEHFEKTWGVPTIKLSELPAIPKKERETSSVARVASDNCHFKKYDSSYGWMDLNGPINLTNACAIPRNRKSIIWDKIETSCPDLDKIATFLGYDRVYGISHKFYDKKRGSLPDLETEIRKSLNAFLVNASELELSAAFSNNDGTYKGLISQTKTLSDACQNLDMVYNTETSRLYDDMARLCKVEVPKVRNYEEEFLARYPLIALLSTWNTDDSKVIDYIKLVEGKS